MLEKIKIDRYSVYEKGRTYEILKFPFIKHMWAYDDHPAEEMMLVDGCKEAFEWMTYACAILANNKDKIIYFSCKQDGIGKTGLGVTSVSMGNLFTEEIQAVNEDVKRFNSLQY